MKYDNWTLFSVVAKPSIDHLVLFSSRFFSCCLDPPSDIIFKVVFLPFLLWGFLDLLF